MNQLLNRIDLKRLLNLYPLMGCTLGLVVAVPHTMEAQGVTNTVVQSEWVTPAKIEIGDKRWGTNFSPAMGPPRQGVSEPALQWLVDKQPNPTTPPLLTNWSNVASLRFWLYLDKPQDWALTIVLTGTTDGYFRHQIPLDWTGWKQVTLPVESFVKVREADLRTTQAVGFRAQGYQQPPILAGTTWWVGPIEMLPRQGTTLPLAGTAQEVLNFRQQWQEVAAKGNPFYQLNARNYQAATPAFTPTSPITTTWQYAGSASNLVPLAFAAADPLSPHRGRADLVARAIANIDWLVNSCSDEGLWWKPGAGVGDPNVNRFTLGPLLDSVRWMRTLPEGEAAWPRWEKKLSAAVDLQRRAYRKEIDWDWGGLNTGLYVNQDAYYALCLALAGQLWKRPEDTELARLMMVQIDNQLLPDGGWHYISVENESPIYHALNMVLVARYATLTGDPVATSMLTKTVNYWPMVMTAEGFPESWSDVWWKQQWNDVAPASVVIAAGATREERNRYLMWRVLERSRAAGSDRDSIYAAPYWSSALGQDSVAAPATSFLIEDRNVRGLRGRKDNWYFGLTQGRGLRNTFVGGLITGPGTKPLRSAFRAAEVLVYPTAAGSNPLRLSQMNDKTAVAYQPQQSGALGTRYFLQKELINGIPVPETPESPWQVTQTWHTDGDGALGLVTLEAKQNTSAFAVAGRLALGPDPIISEGNNLWSSGPLKVTLLKSFGTPSNVKVAYFSQKPEDGGPGLEWKLPIANEQVHAGSRFQYAVWVGPERAKTPQSLEALPNDMGWVTTLPNSRRLAVAFNPTNVAVSVPIPWDKTANVWKKGIAASSMSSVNGQIQLPLSAGECAIVKGS